LSDIEPQYEVERAKQVERRAGWFAVGFDFLSRFAPTLMLSLQKSARTPATSAESRGRQVGTTRRSAIVGSFGEVEENLPKPTLWEESNGRVIACQRKSARAIKIRPTVPSFIVQHGIPTASGFLFGRPMLICEAQMPAISYILQPIFFRPSQ
jgi:hypothetical protein